MGEWGDNLQAPWWHIFAGYGWWVWWFPHGAMHMHNERSWGHNWTANMTLRYWQDTTFFWGLWGISFAAYTFDKKHATKRCPICNAFYHDLGELTVAYECNGYGYDIDTHIVTVYANAAKTCTGMVPTEHFHQMCLEGCKLWASILDDGDSPILEQDLTSTLTLMDSFDHSQRRESGHGCGTFTQQCDNQQVFFHNQEPNDMASKTMIETTSTMDHHSSMGFNGLAQSVNSLMLILTHFMLRLHSIAKKQTRRSIIIGGLPRHHLSLLVMYNTWWLIRRNSALMGPSTLPRRPTLHCTLVL